MNARTILILVLSALWFWFSHYWYTCKILQVCYGCGSQTELIVNDSEPEVSSNQVSETAISYAPLTFNANSSNALTTEFFTSYRDSILNMGGTSDDKVLEITGHYYPNESAPEGYENMGLARADRIKELLINSMPSERIRLKSRLITDTINLSRFEAAEFNWRTVDIKKSEVITTADGANIYFNSGSSQKIIDPKIDEYLQLVAKRVSQSGERIKLTGHTDSDGSQRSNENLGLRRARSVRDILVRYGVSGNKISIESKGESQPVANNATESGKYLNRRCELKILNN